jgi:hypothetical protein
MKLLDACVFAFEGADVKHGAADRRAIRRLGEIAGLRDIFGARLVLKAGSEVEADA